MEGEKDKSGSVEFHLLDLSNRLEAPVEPYLTFFSEERRAAILRYRFPSDRNRTVWAELLVRWLIAQRTGRFLKLGRGPLLSEPENVGIFVYTTGVITTQVIMS